MSAVDEGIVREFFELHGFLVCQRRKYIAQARQHTGDEQVDLIVLNPAAAVAEAPLDFELTPASLKHVARAVVDRALGFGVSRVVIGTRAAESEAFVGELVQAFGDRIAVGIDAKDGRVAVKGWVDTTGAGALDLACRMDALGVATLIHTDIGTDGMLTGPNFPAQEAMLGAGRFGVIASGGVSVVC